MTVYALKASMQSNRRRDSIDQVKEQLVELYYNNINRIKAIADDIKQRLDALNRAQVRGIAALYHLCVQVEANRFDSHI